MPALQRVEEMTMKNKRLRGCLLAGVLVLASCSLPLAGCDGTSSSSSTYESPDTPGVSSYVEFLDGETLGLEIYTSRELSVYTQELTVGLTFRSSDPAVVEVDEDGVVTGVSEGVATVTAQSGPASDSIEITVFYDNPYEDMDREEFYSDYTRAESYTDAVYRSDENLMSGWTEVPDQAPTIAEDQPEIDGKLVHNSDLNFSNRDRTYTVVDSSGEGAFEIYYGAAYTSLEEVAAYVYAWGEVPINYYAERYDYPSPSVSPWGEYLRVNFSVFYGDTEAYPYEPELPDIAGIGGNLVYYEIDIGTTGTDCDPRYEARIYNDGTTITRGAARIVFSRYYRDTMEEVAPEDRYVFYTYNHYNDFQEYLNYEGGWGEMFGNITGGGDISSSSNYNPTPYVETVRASLAA